MDQSSSLVITVRKRKLMSISCKDLEFVRCVPMEAARKSAKLKVSIKRQIRTLNKANNNHIKLKKMSSLKKEQLNNRLNHCRMFKIYSKVNLKKKISKI